MLVVFGARQRTEGVAARRRLQSLLDAEAMKHVDYLTVSVEGHELQVRV